MYKLITRPCYKSDKLLIELYNQKEELSLMLKDINNIFNLRGIECKDCIELWMNDDKIFCFDGELGKFIVTVDIWGLVFIMAEKNQEAIRKIESILIESGKFISEKVDYNNYK